MVALTLMVVPREPKADGGMLGENEGRVNTTLAWGWPPVGGGGGAVGVVVGVLGPVVVVEELAVKLGAAGWGGMGWPVAVATAAAYWLICCMRFLIKSGGRAPRAKGGGREASEGLVSQRWRGGGGQALTWLSRYRLSTCCRVWTRACTDREQVV